MSSDPSQNNASSGNDASGIELIPSFAQSIRNDIVQPAFSKQLTDGIAAQARWKYWGYVFEILTKIFHIAGIISTSFSIYSGLAWVGFLTIIFQSSGIGSSQFSGWCFSEEGRSAAANNKILIDCGVSQQFVLPDDAVAEVGNLVSDSGQASVNNV